MSLLTRAHTYIVKMKLLSSLQPSCLSCQGSHWKSWLSDWLRHMTAGHRAGTIGRATWAGLQHRDEGNESWNHSQPYRAGEELVVNQGWKNETCCQRTNNVDSISYLEGYEHMKHWPLLDHLKLHKGAECNLQWSISGLLQKWKKCRNTWISRLKKGIELTSTTWLKGNFLLDWRLLSGCHLIEAGKWKLLEIPQIRLFPSCEICLIWFLSKDWKSLAVRQPLVINYWTQPDLIVTRLGDLHCA